MQIVGFPMRRLNFHVKSSCCFLFISKAYNNGNHALAFTTCPVHGGVKQYEISSLIPASMAVQPGLCRNRMETIETVYHMALLIFAII